jgi:hypothetical protein
MNMWTIATSACAVAIVLVACTTVPAPLAPRGLAMSIQPGKYAEECFSMAEGERIDYQFQSSAPLDFNLHTHRGAELVTPVEVRQTRAQSGTYSSPRQEDYSMMWTNAGGVPAHLSGQWRRVRR